MWKSRRMTLGRPTQARHRTRDIRKQSAETDFCMIQIQPSHTEQYAVPLGGTLASLPVPVCPAGPACPSVTSQIYGRCPVRGGPLEIAGARATARYLHGLLPRVHWVRQGLQQWCLEAVVAMGYPVWGICPTAAAKPHSAKPQSEGSPPSRQHWALEIPLCRPHGGAIISLVPSQRTAWAIVAAIVSAVAVAALGRPSAADG